MIPSGVAVTPEGQLYFADLRGRIWRQLPDGRLSAVIGPYPELAFPKGIAFDAVGNLYVAEESAHRILRVDPDGSYSVIAGTGESGYAGDGGPPAQAKFAFPTDIAVAADGSLYVADYSNHRIRRIGTDGIISTVAGTGQGEILDSPTGVAIDDDGTLYIADYGNHCIRRLDPDGTLHTVAGMVNVAGFSGDGGPATAARLTLPRDLEVGPDGSLYIDDTGNERIRVVRPNSVIATIAGTGVDNTSGDGGLAAAADLATPAFVTMGPDGVLCFSQGAYRVRKIHQPMPGVTQADITLPSYDGTELYHFDHAGRHQQHPQYANRIHHLRLRLQRARSIDGR